MTIQYVITNGNINGYLKGYSNRYLKGYSNDKTDEKQIDKISFYQISIIVSFLYLPHLHASGCFIKKCTHEQVFAPLYGYPCGY